MYKNSRLVMPRSKFFKDISSDACFRKNVRSNRLNFSLFKVNRLNRLFSSSDSSFSYDLIFLSTTDFKLFDCENLRKGLFTLTGSITLLLTDCCGFLRMVSMLNMSPKQLTSRVLEILKCSVIVIVGRVKLD